MQRLVIASGNPGKLAEFQHLFQGSSLDVLSQSQWQISDAEETGRSFVENALLKARHAARLSGLPALADDSGLCVEALHGAPGLYSARYAGEHGDSAANNAKLLAALEGVPTERRGAFFICVLVLLRHPADPAPLIAEGRWPGRILSAPHGMQGFGYDPLFQPQGLECSAAELDAAEKSRLSHRGQALRLLQQAIRGQGE